MKKLASAFWTALMLVWVVDFGLIAFKPGQGLKTIAGSILMCGMLIAFNRAAGLWISRVGYKQIRMSIRSTLLMSLLVITQLFSIVFLLILLL